MGDGGSLVLGFLLAFLSVRITYATMIPDMPLPSSEPPIFDPARDGIRVYPFSTTWHAIFAPLVVLAIPLYDLTSVVLLRLRQGKNPMVGDLQHISHRFVQRGLSKPTAVAVIWGFAGAAGLAGILLTRTDTAGAILIATQVALLLLVLAAIEFAGGAPAKPTNKPQGAP
jgi:UDP-GlcNAc:undecaprenyl-phosphate GlcNAc-1-phosphate transferase